MNSLLSSTEVNIYLTLNALAYLIFGIWCAADPGWTSNAIGLSLSGAQGLTEFFAVYGGLEFGVGIFFLLCSRNLQLRYSGILFGSCFYVGIVIFRSLAISQVGFDIGLAKLLFTLEALMAIWSVALLVRLQRQT